jgi:hypothetical protein
VSFNQIVIFSNCLISTVMVELVRDFSLTILILSVRNDIQNNSLWKQIKDLNRVAVIDDTHPHACIIGDNCMCVPNLHVVPNILCLSGILGVTSLSIFKYKFVKPFLTKKKKSFLSSQLYSPCDITNTSVLVLGCHFTHHVSHQLDNTLTQQQWHELLEKRITSKRKIIMLRLTRPQELPATSLQPQYGQKKVEALDVPLSS